MNKLKFIADELPKFQNIQTTEISPYLTHLTPYQFPASDKHYIGDKKDELTRWLEEFYDLYKENKPVRYVKMNSHTKNYLRTYYSHEVDYVSKDLEKKFSHPIQGIVLGYGIIVDESVSNFTLIPVIDETNVKRNNKLLKMKFLE